MADLVIVIPFAADDACDLDQSADEMQAFFDSIENHRLGDNVGADIDEVVIVHADTAHACDAGDYVILFAHGGEEDTDLSNNRGETISCDGAMDKLTAIGAQNATRVLCMCCYSGLRDHVGAAWKADHPDQSTFGGDTEISNLYSCTRTQIRAVCAALFAL